MIINKLLFENFRSYYGLHEIELSNDPIIDKNIIVVGGLNGAGKTSFLEGIRLLLFGRLNNDLWSQTSYKSYINKCFNKKAALLGVRQFRLSGEFEIGDIKSFNSLRIERCWYFSDSLELINETLSLFSNGKEKLDLSQEESELYIQERIPFGVSQFVFFDGEKIQDLARNDLFISNTLEAIRSIIGLKIYQDLEHDLWIYEHNMIKENVNDKNFLAIHQAFESKTAQLENTRKQKMLLNRELVENQNQLDSIRKEHKRLGNQQLHDRQEIDETINSLRKKREKIQHNLVSFVSHELPILMLRPLLINLRQHLETEIEIEQEKIVSELLKIKKGKLFETYHLNGGSNSLALENAWSKIFPTLNIDNNLFFRHQNMSIQQKYNLIEYIDTIKYKVSYQAQELIQELDSIEYKIRKVFLERRNIPSDATCLELEEREQLYLNQIKEISQQLGSLTLQEKIQGHEYASAKRSYEIAESNLKLSEDIQLKINKSRLARETVSNFINRLATSRLEQVQMYLNRMFFDLSRKENYILEFIINPETFAIDALDAYSNKIDLDTLSAGEKEIFAISFLWALSKAAVQELPMVIDSPLGRLDSVHRDHLAERFFPNANRQVIILTTDEELNRNLFEKLSYHISKTFLIEYKPELETSVISSGYFF